MGRKKDYKKLNITPFKSGIKNFTCVAEYFLYYSPNIDSCQSAGVIEKETADLVYKELIAQSSIKVKVLKKIQPGSWKELEFETDEIDFEQSRMLFHKMNNESELTALLRHIRNSLAHGYVFAWNKRNKDSYILFVDYDNKKTNKKPRVTAKILVSMTILEKWKAILENQIAIGE